MVTGPTILWFRDDLRTADNPALHAAAKRGEPVVCLYLNDTESPGIRQRGGASRWWLHHSLSSLEHELRELGLSLTLRSGSAAHVIPHLVSTLHAGAVFWNRRYGLAERSLDATIKTSLTQRGVDARSFSAQLLYEPWTLQTAQGKPYQVFTPFWKASQLVPQPRHPFPIPDKNLLHPLSSVTSEDLSEWKLTPTRPDWAVGFLKNARPGAQHAAIRLKDFSYQQLPQYRSRRDFPAENATSGLSAHLAFGEISPFQIWHGIQNHHEDASAFRRQLVWREFAYHLLYFRPDMATKNFRKTFDSFPWQKPEPLTLSRWQQGKTGIPLVDAGMRELWQTGTMHNRVRMVVASFLTKNLLFDWRIGEEWFWQTLLDADPASNPMNWQWVAGCGADAAPYFRVFNPLLQAKKFDPDARYIRHFVPEVDTAAYPQPMVDLAESRHRALAAYAQIPGIPAQGIPGTEH